MVQKTPDKSTSTGPIVYVALGDSTGSGVGARERYQQQIMRYSRRLEEIAARHGATVFDVYSITHAELASHPEYFSADGFHPSDDGYELWATQMWPTVAKVIGVQD
jgi:lysophospholipase L1-like esterase